jgi:hypothetical protein
MDTIMRDHDDGEHDNQHDDTSNNDEGREEGSMPKKTRKALGPGSRR